MSLSYLSIKDKNAFCCQNVCKVETVKNPAQKAESDIKREPCPCNLGRAYKQLAVPRHEERRLSPLKISKKTSGIYLN